MKKLIIITGLLLFFITSNVQAQNMGSSYKTALGVKVYPGSVTFKKFIDDKNAIEGLAYFAERGFRITGLFEIHNDIPDAEGLRWYFGPGLHLTSYKAKYDGGVGLGFDGVLGLDYKVKNAPLNLSLDWQPSYEFGNNISYRGFSANWGGLGIRYTLN